MPSSLHEVVVELFRQRPSLAPELLASSLGMALPDFEQARLTSGELTDLAPTEYRADAVIVLTTTNHPVLAVVVEAQLTRDPDKRWSWPVYLATLRCRLRCPVVLLVVCVDTATATWCATPIELGHPGARLSPLVLSPDRVPLVTDTEQAASMPELAVLSALAHGADPGHHQVLKALLSALESLDAPRATLYADLVFTALPHAARHYLEALMTAGTYEYQSEFIRRYVGQGRAEGAVQAVLAVLDARGIDVPADARTRLTTCTDLNQLDAWLRRAATADTVTDLFT